jgi:flagellar basal body P-ring protein FlgI
MTEEVPPVPASAKVDDSFRIDVPRILSGTVASEAILVNYNPIIVRGYGLVVGLDGTGSSDVPSPLRAHMRAEMSRRGVGQSGSPFAEVEPDELLNSSDTAVVIVEGVIPPGAVGRQDSPRGAIDGTKFDVRVYAHPQTGTTSLEGGRLYTCDLRQALPGEVLPPVGSRQASPLAEARGPIFINPFADPGSTQTGTIRRDIGRVLDGGEVIKDIPLKLRLATPSHGRAETIQNAINTRFPQEEENGQRDRTAHGESDEIIRINVPPSYRAEPREFVELLSHTTIRLSGAERIAGSIERDLKANPAFARSAAWRWRAIGTRALPTVQTLYEYPEDLPRLASLEAGASLGDPLVVPHLVAMAESPTVETRRQAVLLLERLNDDPRVDRALRLRLNDEDLDVRLAAYEAGITRRDPFIQRFDVDEKFILDVIECDYSMIYVSQIGRPRIAVFGRAPQIRRPMLVNTWDGRLIMKAEEGAESVDVYYRTPDGRVSISERTGADVVGFVRFLAHRSSVDSPEPGLDLSYGETIGALFQIRRDGYMDCDFRSQQDRVAAAIARQNARVLPGREEFAEDDAGADLDALPPPPAVGDAAPGP